MSLERDGTEVPGDPILGVPRYLVPPDAATYTLRTVVRDGLPGNRYWTTPASDARMRSLSRRPALPARIEVGAIDPGEPTVDAPEAKTSLVRVVLRRLVFGAFAATVIAIVGAVGMAVSSALGWSFDPHGYGIFTGILSAAVLTPVALVLWLLYQALRPRR